MSPYVGKEQRPDEEFVWGLGVISAQIVNSKRDKLLNLNKRHQDYGVSVDSALEHFEDRIRLEEDINTIEETIGALIGRSGLVHLPPYIQNLDDKPEINGSPLPASEDIVYFIDGELATIRRWE